jgi:hypothetical protein
MAKISQKRKIHLKRAKKPSPRKKSLLKLKLSTLLWKSIKNS